MTEITCYDDYCIWNEDNKCTCEKITLEVNSDVEADRSAIIKCQQFELLAKE